LKIQNFPKIMKITHHEWNNEFLFLQKKLSDSNIWFQVRNAGPYLITIILLKVLFKDEMELGWCRKKDNYKYWPKGPLNLSNLAI